MARSIQTGVTFERFAPNLTAYLTILKICIEVVVTILTFLSTVLYQYKIPNNGKPSANQKAWEVCRNGPKWVLYPEMTHS